MPPAALARSPARRQGTARPRARGGHVRPRADGILLLDADSLRTVRTFPVESFAAALSPDNRTVAAAAEEGTVRLLDLRTGRVRTASGRHETEVQSARFSPDGRTLVTAGDDGTVIVWDSATATPRETLEGHGGRVHTEAMSADGATLYTGSLDGSVIAWDLTGTRRLGRPFTVGTGQGAGGIEPGR